MTNGSNDDILGLAYLVFEVRNIEAWDDLLVDVLGATQAGVASDGARAYRLDERAARIFLVPGDADDLVALGFEARSRAAMWDVAMRARDEGAFVEEGLDSDASERRVARLVRFEEPSGVSIEIVEAPKTVDDPLDRILVPSGYVTGALGVGHVALRADDVAESRRFFETVLGFRLSDRIACTAPDGTKVDVTFLHVNARHHTIALAGALPKHLHHFMLQVGTVTDVGRVLDRCYEMRVPIEQTLGEHPNDRMISFYARTPSGFHIEIGAGGVSVDDATWAPKTYDRISVWGHRRPRARQGVPT